MGSDDDQLRELARKYGLPDDDPQVLEDLRALSQGGADAGAHDAEQEAPPPGPPTQTTIPISPRTIRTVVGAIVGVLVVLYLSGRLDHALYPVGLNLNECGKNGYGSVYCGDELTEYRENVEAPLDNAQTELRESLRGFE